MLRNMKQLKVHMLFRCSVHVSETTFCTRLSQFGSNTRWNRQKYLCDDLRSASLATGIKPRISHSLVCSFVRSFVRFFFACTCVLY